MRTYKAHLGIGLAAIVFAGCEYDTVTEAREQLASGRADTVGFVVPVLRDSLSVSDLLGADQVVTDDGLLGIRVQQDSLSVSVGDQLQFDNIGFDSYTFSFNQMLTTRQDSTQIGTVFPAPSPSGGPMRVPVGSDSISFATDDGSSISSATIESGWLVRTIENTTACEASNLTVDVSAGTDDDDEKAGSFDPVTVAAGATLIDSISLSNVTVGGTVALNANVETGVCVPASGTSISSNVIFRPLTLSSVVFGTLNESFDEQYAALSSETRINAVDTIEVASGTLTLTATNRLPVAVTTDITLDGIVDGAGVPLSNSVVVPAAPGDGSLTSAQIVFDLSATTVIPADVNVRSTGTVTGTNVTIDQTNSTDGAAIEGVGSMVIERLSGALDPDQTPELRISVEQSQTLSSSSVDFADLNDAVQSATINQALIDLTITNGADVPVVLDGSALGIVRLDLSGQPERDMSGDLVFETAEDGTPLLAAIAGDGSGTLTIPRASGSVAGVATATVQAGPLVDRMVKLLLSNVDVALVTTGTAVVGDGTSASISRTDYVGIEYDVTVPLDLTIPVDGIAVDLNRTTSGANMDADQVDALAPRIVEVGLIFKAENGTPFGARVAIAIAPDSLGEDVDIFALPSAVIFDTVELSAPSVDMNGIPQGTFSDSLSLTVTGTDAERLARIALGGQLTAGVTVSLLPATGGAGRGAVRPDDKLVFGTSVIVRVKRGG
ncbi:MAG: hypothetical protein OEZ54_00030 [Gemmatimonadota bacterium]|nr:hypothetical protein [Gemmatimonadota bacterium]